MKALVTGGGGFLGGGIVRALLARGDTVRSFSRGDYPALRNLGVETFQGDLSRTEAVDRAVDGVDIVFHVAAKPGVGGRYEEYYVTNARGTEYVVAACKKFGVPKLVFTSSPSVAFHGTDQEGLNESTPYPARFLAHYPKTKAIAEQFVLDQNGEDLSTIALRPHLIWGPGDTQLVPRIVEQGRAGRLRILGSGEQRVDAVYIDNAVHAHILAANELEPGAPCAGKAYYITNDEPIAIADLINNILGAAGVVPVTRHLSPGLAYAVGGVLEFVYSALHRPGEPPMTRFVARQLATAHWFDISAARRDLGYNPLVTTEEGLQRLAESFRTP